MSKTKIELDLSAIRNLVCVGFSASVAGVRLREALLKSDCDNKWR